MNKLLSIFFILISILTTQTTPPLHAATKQASQHGTAYAKGYGFAYFPKSLEKVVASLNQMPEVKKLIKQATLNGPIGITFQSGSNFEAYWESSCREIILNPNKNRQMGNAIASILFELHNAESNFQLQDLYRLASYGHLSKDEYVEGVERIEHKNALATSALLQEGVDRGIFPYDAKWPIYTSFEDHYIVQQIVGHSQWIANTYNNIASWNNRGQQYKGTLGKYNAKSAKDRDDLYRLLAIKNKLESQDRDEIVLGTHLLQGEIARIEDCFSGRSKRDCSRVYKETALMEKVFGGNPVFESMMPRSHTINS